MPIAISIMLLFVFFVPEQLPEASGAEDGKEGGRHREPERVTISGGGVEVPLGRFLLIRKDHEYCAVIITRAWSGKTDEDWYGTYASYYQDDGSGDFSKEVLVKNAELSSPKPRGIGRLSFSFGNKDICCGPIRLHWAGYGRVSFYGSDEEVRDHGIELAPTKWTDISQVNVFDSRLKWYRYDDNRMKGISIPLESLWTD